MKKHVLLIGILFTFPISLSAQPAGPVEGIWLGTLRVETSELRLAIIISWSEGNYYEGILNSIDQGGAEVPLDKVNLKEDTLEVVVSAAGMTIRGAIDPANGTWTTVFKQGPATFPLILTKVEQLPGMSRPQEPVPPYPYKTEEVSYEHSDAGITLSGTLTIPEGDGPFPAVILLTGSGPQNRDEELLGHKPFLVLADYLTRHGIAVLRSDDRGVGGSSGDFSTATTEDFAGDALAGVEYLKARPDMNFSMIGLAGHSEGGMMAPMAAVRSDDVDFIVLLAAPAIPFEDIIRYQTRRSWIKIGMDSIDIERNTEWQNQIFKLISSEKSDQQVREEMVRLYQDLSEEARTRMQVTEASIESEIARSTSPWWRFAFRFDPVSTLMQVSCPVLAISGDKDTQVTSKENLAAIEKALERGGNRDYRVVELKGLNHLFQTADSGDPLEYGRIEETFSPVAMQVIAEWINKLGK